MLQKLIRTSATAALLLAAACAGRGAASAPAAVLLTSVQATTVGDSVQFVLQVTNPSAQPVGLELGTEPQQYFSVSREGLPIWNSAPDLRRLDGILVDTIQAGATRTFQAVWALPMGLRGTLTATGVLNDRRRPIVQSTRFEIQ